MDWPMPTRWQAAWKARAVYALIGVHDHPGDLPAAQRDGHGQRTVGRGCVVVL
jgi:hypothetical protein